MHSQTGDDLSIVNQCLGDGFNTIMDSVESSLGVPEPGELRAEHLRKEQQLADSVKEGEATPGKLCPCVYVCGSYCPLL